MRSDFHLSAVDPVIERSRAEISQRSALGCITIRTTFQTVRLSQRAIVVHSVQQNCPAHVPLNVPLITPSPKSEKMPREFC